MSGRVLTTREAARFLQVSEASIRRWTNQGLLPASRIGRRRARRFMEQDLLRFMGTAADAPVAAKGAVGAETITVKGMQVGLGSHLASLYGTDAGRFGLGVTFLREGILAGQTCMLYADSRLRKQYLQALASEGVDFDAAIGSGLLALPPVKRASVKEWIATFERFVSDATRDRPGPIRFLGDTTTGLASVRSAAELLTLEQQLSAIVKRLPMVMLCPYDVRAFDGVTLLEALKLHFDTFEHRLGYFLN
jgi:excisionase family DNA binding protein